MTEPVTGGVERDAAFKRLCTASSVGGTINASQIRLRGVNLEDLLNQSMEMPRYARGSVTSDIDWDRIANEASEVARREIRAQRPVAADSANRGVLVVTDGNGRLHPASGVSLAGSGKVSMASLDVGTVQTKNLTIQGQSAKPGAYLMAIDDHGHAEWGQPPDADHVRGPESVSPGTLAMFRNSRSLTPANGLVLHEDGSLGVHRLCVRDLVVGSQSPQDGMILTVRGGKAVWDFDATRPSSPRIDSGLASFEQVSLDLEEACRAATEARMRSAATDARVKETISVLEMLDHRLDQHIAEINTAKRNEDPLADRMDSRAVGPRPLQAYLDEHGVVRLKAFTEPCIVLDDDVDGDQLLVVDADRTNTDQTCLIPSGAEVSRGVLKIQGMQIQTPDTPFSGALLTCMDSSGTCTWVDPPDEGLRTNGQVHIGSIPFYSKFNGRELTASDVTVDSMGTLSCTALQLKSPQFLLHEGQTIMGLGANRTLILGSGLNNIGFGEGALAVHQGANGCVAFGPDALGSFIDGRGVIAIGGGTLANTERAEGIVAIGDSALLRAETVHSSVAVGQNSLSNVSNGNSNTALGHFALSSTLSNANTAVGTYSLRSAVSGNGNTALGSGSASKVVDAQGTVSIGEGAGPIGDFSYSISIGRGARARTQGDLALGSQSAPLKTSDMATAGNLPVVGPSAYLQVCINGRPYKLALYDAEVH